jgi:hypothetical protein
MKTKIQKTTTTLHALLVLATSTILSACGNSVESSFKSAVNEYWTSTQNKDYERVVSYFFRAKLAAMGGMEEAKKAVSQAYKPLKITKWEIGNTQVEHDKGDIYIGIANITFEANRKNQLNGKTYHIKSETGMIGHSDNKGKTWHFVGVTPEEHNIMGTFAPDLFQTMRIPQEKLYVLEDGKWQPFTVK